MRLRSFSFPVAMAFSSCCSAVSEEFHDVRRSETGHWVLVPGGLADLLQNRRRIASSNGMSAWQVLATFGYNQDDSKERHPTLGASGCLLKDKATAFLIVRWKHTVDS